MIAFQEVDFFSKTAPAFDEFFAACDDTKYLIYVLKGGRGSSKSSSISLEIISRVMELPINALVVRKVANTLKESVFEQLLWAIDRLEVERYWKKKVSPLELTYSPRGNKIIFRGADEPDKIKSIKTHKFPIAILWIEETAEFKTEEEVYVVINSVLREELYGTSAWIKFMEYSALNSMCPVIANTLMSILPTTILTENLNIPGDIRYFIFLSYNPPKRRQSWCNKLYNSVNIPKNTYVHHSTYRDNPFISRQFKELAEDVKQKSEHKYRWIYNGEAIGGGIIPFDNLVFRTIADEEIATFDNIKQGIDWGYAADPFHFGRYHFDRKHKILYFIDEIHEVKLSNYDAAMKIKAKGYEDALIMCGHDEPKSKDEMNLYGLYCECVSAGPGSVEFGEKGLDGLTAIVIDHKRTPNAAREFENIEYQIDKNGETKSKLEDKENHCIAGETIINTINGDFKIKELIGKTGEVYCVNTLTNKIVKSNYYNVKKTIENADIYEIETVDGRKIRCTEEHLILTKGGWKRAIDLTEADDMVAMQYPGSLCYAKVKSIKYIGKDDVYNLEVEKYQNFPVSGGLIIHNSIDCSRYAMQDEFLSMEEEKKNEKRVGKMAGFRDPRNLINC